MQQLKRIPHSRPSLGDAEAEAAHAVIAAGFVGSGPRAAELEAAVSAATGRPFAFAVSSGFHALSLAVRALDLPAGSVIGLPVLTCGSVVAAIRGAGHRPRLLDLREDLTLDPNSVIRGEVAAFAAPHAYGAPLDVEALAAIGIPWVEDCATSPATTTRNGKRAGTSGTCAIFSLGSTKYFTGGAGGVLTTSDDTLAARVGDLLDSDRAQPAASWTHTPPAAWPGRLSDLAAAVALEQWRRIPEFAARRRVIAAAYDQLLARHPALLLPPRDAGHSFFRYLVRTSAPASELAAALRAREIDARDSVNPWLDTFAGVDASAGPWPGAARWRGHLLSLPIYPQLTDAEVESVAATLLEVLAHSHA